MKKILSLFTLMFCLFQAKGQYGYDIKMDEQSGKTIFVGRCTFDDLNDEASYDWMRLKSNDYNPIVYVTDSLKKKLPSCELVIFMGTWCEDTQELLPKLYKTMMLSHSFTNYKMFALDRNKKSKNNEQDAYKVTLVPTIIVLKNGAELGRIVEMPRKSIEEDLLKIIEAKKE